MKRFRNYDSLKFFLKIFLNSQKRREVLCILLKMLKISEKSNSRFVLENSSDTFRNTFYILHISYVLILLLTTLREYKEHHTLHEVSNLLLVVSRITDCTKLQKQKQPMAKAALFIPLKYYFLHQRKFPVL